MNTIKLKTEYHVCKLDSYGMVIDTVSKCDNLEYAHVICNVMVNLDHKPKNYFYSILNVSYPME